MKKALSIMLALVLVLSLCGSAFAAGDNLTMSYSTSIVNGQRVNIFEYRDAEGRLMREETDTLGSQGQLVEKKVNNYNEEGKTVSSRVMCLEDNGAWKDDEAVWTYFDDGSEIMDERVVFTYPDKRQEFRVVQTKTDAEGKSEGRGEGRDVNGNKLYDITLTYDVSENERTNIVKYSYPNGTSSTERDRKQSDGTEIRETFDENAAGQDVKMTYYQQNPDGSYRRTSTSTTYRDNGKSFVSQVFESMDADGRRRTESSSYNMDADGVGSGRGRLTDEDGRQAIILIDYRISGGSKVGTTTYKFDDGSIDLKTEITTAAGVITSTYEQDVKNYGDSDDDTENPDEDDEDAAAEADPFDTWGEVFGDWYEEASYPGDPTGLDGDSDYNYYETGADWGDESDWGDASDWSYDGGDYEDFGGWDEASDW